MKRQSIVALCSAAICVLVSGCGGASLATGDDGGSSGDSSAGADATSSGDGAVPAPGSGDCTGVADPRQCASCPALPKSCEVCSNGETKCAHYVVQNGSCAVEWCLPDAPTLGDAGVERDAAPMFAWDAASRVGGTCMDAEQGLVTLTSLAQVNALLVGRWMRCSSDPAGVTMTHSPDEVGIEFEPDGNWYTLTQTDGGPLVRSTLGSLMEQGTWNVIDNGAFPTGVNAQINVNFGSGGFLPWSPTFSVTPTEFSAVSDPGSVVYVVVP